MARPRHEGQQPYTQSRNLDTKLVIPYTVATLDATSPRHEGFKPLHPKSQLHTPYATYQQHAEPFHRTRASD